MERFGLQGQRALVTGSTKGIGAAIVDEFLKLGASVIVTARSGPEVESRVGELRKVYGADRVHGMACDVTAAADRAGLVKFIADIWDGELDILVNNVRACNVH